MGGEVSMGVRAKGQSRAHLWAKRRRNTPKTGAALGELRFAWRILALVDAVVGARHLDAAALEGEGARVLLPVDLDYCARLPT